MAVRVTPAGGGGEAKDPRHETLRDVRAALDKSTRKMSTRDLEKQGFRQVKVIEQSTIRKLILEAVDRVLTKFGTAQAKNPEILRKVEEELAAAMKERQAIDDELEALRREITQMDSLEEESATLRTAYEAEKARSAKLQEMLDLAEKAVEEGAALEQTAMALERERDRLEGEVAALRRLDETRSTRIEEMLVQLTAAAGQGAGKVDAGMLDDLAKRLSRSLAPRPADAGALPEEAAVRAIVADLDRQEVETNVANLKAKERKSLGGVGDALKKLKELKGE